MQDKPFLVTRDDSRRIEYVKSARRPRVGLFRTQQSTSSPLAKQFDRCYTLKSLYNDETFFDAMANVTGDTTLFIVDLGIEYHCGDASYIKPYTKIKPLSLQAGIVRVIDSLAFYYSPCSVIRSFFYIHGDFFPETLQEFYGVGPYEGNGLGELKSFVPRIEPHVEMKLEPFDIEVVRYLPTEREIADYEKLKHKTIMVDRLSKSAVLNKLFAYINNSSSRVASIESAKAKQLSSPSESLLIENNDYRQIYKTYERIVGSRAANPKLIFFSSGTYGCDESALSQTLGALREHNQLIRALSAVNQR